MFDLKVISSVLNQLEDERGVPRDQVIEAVEEALAAAYKKEYGRRGQDIRAQFDPETGEVHFEQIKEVVDDSIVYDPDKGRESDDERDRFNPEAHIYLEDAKRMKRDANLGEEIIFPLEVRTDFGRIASQTAKQVIIQKIREAERVSVYKDFANKRDDIVSGKVQRFERGNYFIDLGRATGILPYEEQIPRERFKQGERVRALLYSVEESSRGIYLRLSRSRPEFLTKLFEIEAPEVASGTVEIKKIAREAGSRSKVAVMSHDEYVDPVGSLVGQRGVRVSTVTSELGGEKIDIIEWSEYSEIFIEEAMSPAEVVKVDIDEEEKKAIVYVSPDQQSLAIGKGGQNARLAAKITGYTIDVQAVMVGDDGTLEPVEEAAREDAKESPKEPVIDQEMSPEDVVEGVSGPDDEEVVSDVVESETEEERDVTPEDRQDTTPEEFEEDMDALAENSDSESSEDSEGRLEDEEPISGDEIEEDITS